MDANTKEAALQWAEADRDLARARHQLQETKEYIEGLESQKEDCAAHLGSCVSPQARLRVIITGPEALVVVLEEGTVPNVYRVEFWEA